MTIELTQGEGWLVLVSSLSAGFVWGHNFWLTLRRERGVGATAEKLRVEAHTGHHFPGGESAVAPERVAACQLHTATGTTPLSGFQVEGQALVTETVLVDAGTPLAALILQPRSITLAAEKFASYIADEDATATVAPDFQAGVTTEPQHEIYTKYAKALLSVPTIATDSNDWVCHSVGHRMEIVPECHPALLCRGARLPVRVLFDGHPVAGVRVSSGCAQLAQGGYAAHVYTDAAGRAEVELPCAGYWFVRAHRLQRHPDPTVAQWESFWPSLTFQIEA